MREVHSTFKHLFALQYYSNAGLIKLIEPIVKLNSASVVGFQSQSHRVCPQAHPVPSKATGAMQDYIDAIFALDAYVWTMSVVLSLFASGLLTMFLGSWERAVVFFPALVFGSLATNHLLQLLQFDLTADKELNVVAVSTVGTMLATIVMLVLFKLANAAMQWTVKPPPQTAVGNHVRR